MFCHTGANSHPEESKVIFHTTFGSKVELSFNQQTSPCMMQVGIQ